VGEVIAFADIIVMRRRRTVRQLHERCVAIVAASVEAARAELATAPIHERGVWVSRVRKLGELEVYASMVG
jgi:hypothetical protein